MNAQPNAIAHAPATALAHAIHAGSVDAKGREGTGPHRTTPNGVFALGEFPIHLSLGDARRAEKFWAHVQWAEGDLCWEWMAEKNHRGYGRFTFQNRRMVAHRVAHELVKGPIPGGLQCGHLCHNPGCVRPDHLEAMTAKENIRQRDERMGRTPGSAMTGAERSRRRAARLRAAREQQRIESGWWVSI